MKIRAAHDWLRYVRSGAHAGPNPPSAKHAFDVVLLTAMLTEAELEEAGGLALEYWDHPIAQEVRREAETLYGTPGSLGWVEARQQSGRDLDHELIWEALSGALALER